MKGLRCELWSQGHEGVSEGGGQWKLRESDKYRLGKKGTAEHGDHRMRRGELGNDVSHPLHAGVLATKCTPPGWGCTSCLSLQDPDQPRTTADSHLSVSCKRRLNTPFPPRRQGGLLEAMQLCHFLPPFQSNGNS